MIKSDANRIVNGIRPDPIHPGPGDVRLAQSWVPVWAIIGHLRASGRSVVEVADDYGIGADEVETAIAYYRIHHADIDARLRANENAPVGRHTLG